MFKYNYKIYFYQIFNCFNTKIENKNKTCYTITIINIFNVLYDYRNKSKP